MWDEKMSEIQPMLSGAPRCPSVQPWTQSQAMETLHSSPVGFAPPLLPQEQLCCLHPQLILMKQQQHHPCTARQPWDLHLSKGSLNHAQRNCR